MPLVACVFSIPQTSLGMFVSSAAAAAAADAQVSLPEIDGAIEPIIYAGREGATGRSVPLSDRVQLVADRALKVDRYA